MAATRTLRKRVCGSSSTKRAAPKKTRRTKADMLKLRAAIYEIVDRYKPMSVRQVFYQMSNRKLIKKTESEYNKTTGRLLTQMRKSGVLPFRWITDNTRWMRKPDTYGSLGEMLDLSQQMYRRAVWNDQGVHVEVWLEKDALAGILYDVTSEWDVPLYVCRGYSSLSFLYSAAETLSEIGKPAFLYYFGDHDPSGRDISRYVEATLRQYVKPDTEFVFERVAVEPWQIRRWNLPSRPTKKSDSRSKGFKGESVEVDAIDPDMLRRICRNCITQHIDEHALQATQQIQEAERETLQTVLDRLNDDE